MIIQNADRQFGSAPRGFALAWLSHSSFARRHHDLRLLRHRTAERKKTVITHASSGPFPSRSARDPLFGRTRRLPAFNRNSLENRYDLK